MTNKVWCLLIDHETRLVGEAFYVILAENEVVADLKEKVKEEVSSRLDHIAPNTLLVWRCKDQTTALGELDSTELEEHIGKLFDDHNRKVGKLNPMLLMAELMIREKEILLV